MKKSHSVTKGFLTKAQLFCLTVLWLPWWLSSNARQRKKCEFHPWVGKIPWRRKWQPTPVFLVGKFHGQRSLAGSSSQWGRTEWDTTLWLNNLACQLVLCILHEEWCTMGILYYEKPIHLSRLTLGYLHPQNKDSMRPKLTLEKLTYKAGSYTGNICEDSLSKLCKGSFRELADLLIFCALNSSPQYCPWCGLVSWVLGTN